MRGRRILLLLLVASTAAMSVPAGRSVRSAALATAQAGADAAALAGASAFLDLADPNVARERALEYVGLNSSSHVTLSTRAEDVALDPEEGRVTVLVQAQLTHVPAALLWVFGARGVVARAQASAEALSPRCFPRVSEEGIPGEVCVGQIKRLRLVD